MGNSSKYTTSNLLSIREEILAFLLIVICVSAGFSQTESNLTGWHLIGYSFKDGSMQKETVLAGTTSQMNDVISFRGEKGNIEITQNRFDVKTGKLLAGVTYQVIWTNPPAILRPMEKISLDYKLNTMSSLSWKAPQQSVYINQGLYGVYFFTPDGTKYITKDINSKLTSQKEIEKGTKGAKRIIQLSFGNGFAAIYNYEWREGNTTEKQIINDTQSANAWHFTGYLFKDGTLQKESVLAGTSSKMNDVISFQGNKGNIEITHNRYDVKTGKLLAGVIYKVLWTDPPANLRPDEKISLDFQLVTMSTVSWKAPQQSVYLNQGLSGIYFITPDGTKFITKDVKSKLTTEKVIEKGSKGVKRALLLNFGNGFSATYNYEWREF